MKKRATVPILYLLLLCFVLMPCPASATDVDGPNDCLREVRDYGDAPEGVQAYPGILGRFPTCRYPGPIGTQEIYCGSPLSSPPGPAGFVWHVQYPEGVSYWLGCQPGGSPLGIDPEQDGKTNDNGGPLSACVAITVDCFEPAFGLVFGQDECYGTNDAGIAAPVVFTACVLTRVAFQTYNCGPIPQQVYLNILVDWNQDGDWNDNLACTGGGCAYEWAVVNSLLLLPPGCNTLNSPSFLAGPQAGPGWMRISLSSTPVSPDFPWNGTASLGGPIYGGETEDYPVNIEGTSCPEYLDFGDAPEDDIAYPSGVQGRFPTCIYPGPSGTQEIAIGCPPVSPPPAVTGHVLHRQNLGDPVGFWLGCWQPFGVDNEPDGKTNGTGAPNSRCNPTVLVDCVEAAFGGMNFGQDECTGDGVDAGVPQPLLFQACQSASVTFDAFNCEPVAHAVVLNILVDWNEDGDWNDVVLCPGGQCVPEWAVQNVSLMLNPGCQTLQSPPFLTGRRGGFGWLRITLTDSIVPPDFPWNGSLSTLTGEFDHGETEDYPVVIEPMPDPCPEYRDLGDAPEDAQAYPGVPGFFPTCRLPGPAGTQELAAACPAISTPPGRTGFVEHNRPLGTPLAFWLGCWQPGVDGEIDGKMNDTGAPASACFPNQAVDCVEAAFGLSFGQDECSGDGVDAGIHVPLQFTTCRRGTVTFDAMNCGPPADVYLNVLVDWNHDGDWNDSFWCPTVGCAYEWAVKNVLIALPNGCTTQTSPAFLAGPNPGGGWLRITLSEKPAPDDFPWNGTQALATQVFEAGETEDYPVVILRGDPCEEPYIDYGDAPEDFQAYPGIPGHFPTCLNPGPPGTMEIMCGVPVGLPPGPTGFVRHVSGPQLPYRYWLGCPDPLTGFPGVDSESDGKSNDNGSPLSKCNPNQPIDCVEPVWLPFGQDECTGDLDAGIKNSYVFPQCTLQQVQFLAYNCGPPTEALVNVLVDWNRDGDWNDNILCPYTTFCAREWVVKNLPIVLQPGCNVYVTPPFRVGPHVGPGWMRVTLSMQGAPDDFPWNGTLGLPGNQFEGGETEDYPILISDSPIGVTETPTELALAPAVPNPARGTTTLRFTVPAEQEVTLAAYDIHGRQVRALRGGKHSAGAYTVAWDFTNDGGGRLPAGVYLVKLTAGDQVFTQRVIRVQ